MSLRSNIEKNMNKILIIKKESGAYSFKIFNFIKKNINSEIRLCGILDLFASGIFLVLINKNKLHLNIFLIINKRYHITVRFITKCSNYHNYKIFFMYQVHMLHNFTQLVLYYSRIKAYSVCCYMFCKKKYKIEKIIKKNFLGLVILHFIYFTSLNVTINVNHGFYIREHSKKILDITRNNLYIQSLNRAKYSFIKSCGNVQTNIISRIILKKTIFSFFKLKTIPIVMNFLLY